MIGKKWLFSVLLVTMGAVKASNDPADQAPRPINLDDIKIRVSDEASNKMEEASNRAANIIGELKSRFKQIQDSYYTPAIDLFKALMADVRSAIVKLTDNTEVQKMRDDLSKRTAEINQNLADTQRELDQATTALREAQDKNENLRRAMVAEEQRAGAAAASAKSLKERLAETSERISELKSKSEISEMNVKRFTEQGAAALTEREAILADLKRSEAEVKQITTDYELSKKQEADLQARLTKTQNELSTLNAKVAKIMGELAMKDANMAEMKRKIDLLNNQLQDAQRNQEATRASINNLTTQGQSIQDTTRAAQSTAVTLQQSLNDLTRQQQTLQVMYKDMQVKYAEKLKKLDGVNAEVEKKKQEYRTLEAAMAQLNTEVRLKNQQLEAARKQIEFGYKAKKEIDDARALIEIAKVKAEAELRSLTGDLARANAELKRVQDQCNASIKLLRKVLDDTVKQIDKSGKTGDKGVAEGVAKAQANDRLIEELQKLVTDLDNANKELKNRVDALDKEIVGRRRAAVGQASEMVGAFPSRFDLPFVPVGKAGDSKSEGGDTARGR